VVDDAIDERGGAGRVREDGGPLLEREVGGEHEALSLVTTADDLEEEIGVAVIEGEIAELVDDEEALLGVVPEAPLEAATGLLGAEIEEHLRGGGEQHRVPGEDGLMGDVLSDHRLAEALRRDEDDVACRAEEVQADRGLDERAVDL